MHDLDPTPALGGTVPQVDAVGEIVIREVWPLAIASVAARQGSVEACMRALESFLGSVPDVGQALSEDGRTAFWVGPEQWFICSDAEDLPTSVKSAVGEAASVTEQSGAWAAFDLAGERLPDLVERLCNVPIRTMPAGAVQRTIIHHLGCFVWRRSEVEVRILGPRAAARSLHHAIMVAARSIA